MATTTYIINEEVAYGNSSTDVLAGTAVSNAGSTGKVWVSITAQANAGGLSTTDTDAAKCTATLVGRESGVNVIPSGSGCVVSNLDAHGRVVFYGRVTPNEPLSLTLDATSAVDSNVFFSVMVKTE